jgi:DNA-directed RNA polymerase beta' subunit
MTDPRTSTEKNKAKARTKPKSRKSLLARRKRPARMVLRVLPIMPSRRQRAIALSSRWLVVSTPTSLI